MDSQDNAGRHQIYNNKIYLCKFPLPGDDESLAEVAEQLGKINPAKVHEQMGHSVLNLS